MLISIITINYNNKLGLEKTIKSVKNQDYLNFEFIIVDGGSSDESQQIIQSNQGVVSFWCSEKDNGVYDAMNKGIALSNGDYLLMLNSGDYLANSSILKNISNFLVGNEYDIVYGDVIWEDNDVLTNGVFPDVLSFDYFRKHSLGHQAAFIKRDLHKLIGDYDTKIKISSDWKFFLLAICRYNTKYLHAHTAISVCSRDGISCNPNSLPLILEERENVLNENFPTFLSDYNLMDKNNKKLKVLEQSFLLKLYKSLLFSK